LNVDLDLSPFDRFHPCGFEGPVMTSLGRETGHPIAVGAVKPHIVRAFQVQEDRARPAAPPIA
jgi:lipoate-protein ligase B